ncbi:uncharacterized protein LOC117331516 [Pecten maximus]|uniref:uncharacterized protein LOC117331516 n=1 Tax=Pecten maximus TaxID=6579 RepID=UPI00145805AB|nr:uncharacterized protein LOC117331516 [Pecten maximus]XP_033746149.1 uncharacterized protein LOC117331516 [Pecten maximus]
MDHICLQMHHHKSKYKTNLSIKEKEDWKAYEESGELPVEVMESLFEKETDQQFIEKFQFICIVMETLGLISSPLLDSEEELEIYIVPCMLRAAIPSRIQPILDKPSTVKTPVLCVKFDKDFIPQAIWDKIIAKCIHRFKPMEEDGYDQTDFIQRGFVCLAVDSLWKVVLNCHKNAMIVILFTRSKSQIPSGKGVKFREFLDFLLQTVLEMNHQGHFRYSYYLHNDYEFSKNEQMVKAEDLSELDGIFCRGGKGESCLSKKDYDIWFQPITEAQTSVKTVDGLPVHLPERKPSPKELGRISKFIGIYHLSFFMELECPIDTVDRFFLDYQKISRRVPITKSMVAFFNKTPKRGFSHIASAMTEGGMNIDLQTILEGANREDLLDDFDVPENLLQRPMSIDHVSIVSDFISPRESYILFLELGLKETIIEREEVSCINIQEQITTLLELWIKVEGEAATVRKLLQAMAECDMDIQGLVRSIEENI